MVGEESRIFLFLEFLRKVLFFDSNFEEIIKIL